MRVTSKRSNLYYVYVLSRPDGRPFYIGKGKKARIFQHEWEAQRGHKCHKCNIIRKIWNNGDAVHRDIVFVTASQEYAFDFEKGLIAAIGREYLVNRSDGGEGAGANTQFNRERAGRIDVEIWLSDDEKLVLERLMIYHDCSRSSVINRLVQWGIKHKILKTSFHTPGGVIPMKARRKGVMIYLSAEEKKQLERLAKKGGRTQSDMARYLIRRAADAIAAQEEPIIEIPRKRVAEYAQ